MDEEKIEEYLKRQGISSMQDSGPKKVVCSLWERRRCCALWTVSLLPLQLSEEQVAGSSFQLFLLVLTLWPWSDAFRYSVLLALRCRSPGNVSASPLAPPLSWQRLLLLQLCGLPASPEVLSVSAGSLLHPPGLPDLHPPTCFLLVPDFALVLITLSCPWWRSDPLGTRFYCRDNPRSSSFGRICSWMKICELPRTSWPALCSPETKPGWGIFHWHPPSPGHHAL